MRTEKFITSLNKKLAEIQVADQNNSPIILQDDFLERATAGTKGSYKNSILRNHIIRPLAHAINDLSKIGISIEQIKLIFGKYDKNFIKEIKLYSEVSKENKTIATNLLIELKQNFSENDINILTTNAKLNLVDLLSLIKENKDTVQKHKELFIKLSTYNNSKAIPETAYKNTEIFLEKIKTDDLTKIHSLINIQTRIAKCTAKFKAHQKKILHEIDIEQNNLENQQSQSITQREISSIFPKILHLPPKEVMDALLRQKIFLIEKLGWSSSNFSSFESNANKIRQIEWTNEELMHSEHKAMEKIIEFFPAEKLIAIFRQRLNRSKEMDVLAKYIDYLKNIATNNDIKFIRKYFVTKFDSKADITDEAINETINEILKAWPQKSFSISERREEVSLNADQIQTIKEPKKGTIEKIKEGGKKKVITNEIQDTIEKKIKQELVIQQQKELIDDQIEKLDKIQKTQLKIKKINEDLQKEHHPTHVLSKRMQIKQLQEEQKIELMQILQKINPIYLLLQEEQRQQITKELCTQIYQIRQENFKQIGQLEIEINNLKEIPIKIEQNDSMQPETEQLQPIIDALQQLQQLDRQKAEQWQEEDNIKEEYKEQIHQYQLDHNVDPNCEYNKFIEQIQ